MDGFDQEQLEYVWKVFVCSVVFVGYQDDVCFEQGGENCDEFYCEEGMGDGLDGQIGVGQIYYYGGIVIGYWGYCEFLYIYYENIQYGNFVQCINIYKLIGFWFSYVGFFCLGGKLD